MRKLSLYIIFGYLEELRDEYGVQQVFALTISLKRELLKKFENE